MPIIYSEAELWCWMPLPTPLPKLRSVKIASGRPKTGRIDDEGGEDGGSGI